MGNDIGCIYPIQWCCKRQISFIIQRQLVSEYQSTWFHGWDTPVELPEDFFLFCPIMPEDICIVELLTNPQRDDQAYCQDFNFLIPDKKFDQPGEQHAGSNHHGNHESVVTGLKCDWEIGSP